MLKDLEKVRGHLGLGPEDAVGVEKRVVDQWESERKAKEEAEHKDKEEAERKAKEETESKAEEEAERKAKEEAECKAKEEAEGKAKEEAEGKEKEEAEGKAKEHVEEAKALVRVKGLQAFLLIKKNSGEVNVLVAPDIPEKKLKNAIPRYEVPPDELVIGLIDATVFGSAKEGLIFGSQGVYFKNSDGSGPHAVPYSVFSSCNFDVDGYHVKFAEDLYFYIGSAEPTAALLNRLCDFLKYQERALEEYQGYLTVEDVDAFVSELHEKFWDEMVTRAKEDVYRAFVEVYLSDDNRISEIERGLLENKRIELKLSKEQASAIEAGIEAGEIQSIG